LLGICQCQV